MPLDNVLGVALVLGLFGLLILIPLWPGGKQGAKVLRRWGVPDPAPSDVAEAVRYLRRRRFWYPWLFLGLPLLPFGLGEDTLSTVLATLLLGALIAEVLAQRPPRGARREATLDSRGVHTLIPVWGLATYAAVVAATAAWLVVHRSWALLGAAAVTSAIAWLVILLAVRRPSTGAADGAVDAALRVRSARVAAGLGLAATAALAGPVQNLLSWILVVAGLAGWFHLAGGVRGEVARCR